MFADMVLPIIGVMLPYLGVGLLLTRSSKKLREDGLEHLAVAFLLGAGVFTLWQFLGLLVGIPVFWSLRLGWLVGFIGCIDVLRHRSTFRIYTISTLVILVILPLFFIRSFSRIMYTWDTRAFWVPKMFALWQMDRLRPDALTAFNHPEYPLLLPMSGANAFSLFGFPNEVGAKVVLFGFTIALIVLFSRFLEKTVGGWKAAFWTLLFLSLFIVREHLAGEYVGTADILMGTYLAAGATQLLQKRKLLALALWSLAAWTKSEGLVWAVSTTGLVVIHEVLSKKKISISSYQALGTSLLVILPWFLYNKFSKLDSSQYFKFKEIYARPWVEYAIYSVHAFREEFRNLEKWNFVFYLFILKSLLSFRRIALDERLRIIYLALAAQLVMYLAIFTVTPEEQATFIAAAISRLTLHFVPTVLLVTAVLFSPAYKQTKV